MFPHYHAHKSILLDLDGVVVTGKRFSIQYEEDYGVTWDELMPFFTGPFRQCLIGKADLKTELTPYLSQWNFSGTIDEFMHYWFSNGAEPNDDLLNELQLLRSTGMTTYILTNNERYRTEYLWRDSGLHRYFDGIYSSARLGILKDDPRFFTTVLHEIHQRPDVCLFLDDDEANVATAKKCGIDAYFYTTETQG